MSKIKTNGVTPPPPLSLSLSHTNTQKTTSTILFISHQISVANYFYCEDKMQFFQSTFIVGFFLLFFYLALMRISNFYLCTPVPVVICHTITISSSSSSAPAHFFVSVYVKNVCWC